MLRSSLFLVIASVFTAACSSSSQPAPTNGQTSAALSKYCTATLTNDHALMLPQKGGAWVGDGSARASAGTTFYLGASFERWVGYVLRADGTPAEIDADFGKGLVAGTDFSSSCADPAKLVSIDRHFVLLADTKLYNSAALTGAACMIAAGTELAAYSYSATNEDVVTIQAPAIQEKCGFDKAYAANAPFVNLVLR